MLCYRSEIGRSSTRPSITMPLTPALRAPGNLAHARSANWHLIASRPREKLWAAPSAPCYRRVPS